MGKCSDIIRNVLDKFGRRSGLDRRVDQIDSFPFDRRNPDERRQNGYDRRKRCRTDIR